MKFTKKLVVLCVTAKQPAKGKDQILSDTEKAVIGEYASEHGVASVVRIFDDKTQ